MSYCRWSSDNFKSDIYAYESAYGYVIHVKASRVLNIDDIPKLPNPLEDVDAWIAAIGAQHDWLADQAKHAPLELPDAGATFTARTLDDFEARLRDLAGQGFHVPPGVFAMIEDEREEG